MVTKTADNKGRVALGERFANQQVIIEEVDSTEVRVIVAAVIPQRELWLHRNPKALGKVLQGLDEAKGGQFSQGPDLTADPKDCDESESE